eukprot:TRINITY_DN1005_c0_g1_i2.p1 TRINITY_DN1005_c0_g1~~TRINITY_DN1005_c0_g1_i2.p1  ORF type:complete len:203 (-),score=48.68 TRINITY_DN1005_c0_g1_i2:66-674(-)
MGCLQSQEGPLEDSNTYDYLFKLVLVGASGVGKSSLVLKFTEDTFSEQEIDTIGFDFKVRYLYLDDVKIKVQIWDTAGQEKYREMTSSYFGGAHAAVAVYDVTSEESFKQLETWINEAITYAGGNTREVESRVRYLIIGNKKDLEKDRKVTSEEGSAVTERLVGQNGIFQETSARTGKNVEQAFTSLITELLALERGTNERV